MQVPLRHFNEWAPAWRAPDEAAEIADRVSRSTHAWTVTHAEWPYRYFPSFAVGTAHGLNRAAVRCFEERFGWFSCRRQRACDVCP